MLLRSLAAVIAGSVAVLAFAPFDFWWLLYLSFAALFLLWKDASPRQAFLLGWLFGCGLLGFGIFWLRNSLAQFGGINLPVAIILTLLFSMSMAMFYGVAGWLSSRLSSAGSYSRLILVIPATLVLAEWVRGWFLGGFPWLSAGYAQLQSPLVGYAPVLGVFGVSLTVVVTVGLLVSRHWRLGVLLVPMWGGGWALQQVDWGESAGADFQVALVQGNIPQAEKWRPTQFQPSMDLYLEETQRYPEAKLVVWPETAIPAYADTIEEALLKPLGRWFSAEERDFISGIAVRGVDGAYYNAMIGLGENGRQHYYKRHLVPFGEFMPLRPLLEPLVEIFQIPMSSFSAGTEKQQPMVLAGHVAGISICYEDAFGEEVIAGLPDAAYLINASNDAWFGDSLAPHQHLQIARMRTLETDRFLVRATNNGISAVIDNYGSLVATIPQFQRGSTSALLEPRRGTTPFVRFGNMLVVVVVIGMLFAGWWFRRRDLR
ncbi:MAG: apolipoprotein N-acyltransferase [bacterium]